MTESIFTFKEGTDVQILEGVKELILPIEVKDEFYIQTGLSRSENPPHAFTIWVQQSKETNKVNVYLCNEGFLCPVQFTEEEKKKIIEFVKENQLHSKAGLNL
jgi:hypothetical protein